MISFIICSHRPEFLDKCKQSIINSINNVCDYEFVVVEGKKGGIFRAYDRGAKSAKFPILCFLHEDVELLSYNYWVEPLQSLLSLERTGLVGVAGSKDFTRDGRWWAPNNRLSGAVMHSNNNQEWFTSYGPYGEVVMVDGLIFFINKEIYNRLGGYQKTDLKGYHYYDVDLSLRAHWEGYRNYTISLLVRHSSVGEMPPEWSINRQKWLARYYFSLPARVEDVTENSA